MKDMHALHSLHATLSSPLSRRVALVAAALVTLSVAGGCSRQSESQETTPTPAVETPTEEAPAEQVVQPPSADANNPGANNAAAGAPPASQPAAARTGAAFQLQPVQLRMPENATQRMNSGLARPQLGAAPAGARPRLSVPQLQPPPPPQ